MPLMLPPLEPAMPVDGVTRSIGAGFAARLLAVLDPGAPAPATGETPMWQGGDALVAVLAALDLPPVMTPHSVAGAGAPAPGAEGSTAAEPGTATVTPSIAGAPQAPGPVVAPVPPDAAVAAGGSQDAVVASPASPMPARVPSAAVAAASQQGPSEPIAAGATTAGVLASTGGPATGSHAARATSQPRSRAGRMETADAPATDTPPAAASDTTAPRADADARRVAASAGSAEGVTATDGRHPSVTSAGPVRTATADQPAPDGTADAPVETAPASTRPVAPSRGDPPTGDRAPEVPVGRPATPADPAMIADGEIAPPTTQHAPAAADSTGVSAPPPPTPMVARIVELVERLRNEPPPQQIIVDLETFGVGRLAVSLRGDTVVVEALDANARFDPQWQEDLGAALDERGWSFEGDGRSRREDRGGPASPAHEATAGSRPATRPDDGHLRL